MRLLTKGLQPILPAAASSAGPRVWMPDEQYLAQAIQLAARGFGRVSPNPMVGALLVRNDRVIGRGWHRQAGAPHAEIEAFQDAERRGATLRNATLYVTLEPCCTTGRTPPCTEAIIRSGVRRVVVGATDPNPLHRGRGFKLLRQAGLQVEAGLLAREAASLNEVFNYWIQSRRPFVTLKCAMTMDGKIATRAGRSAWITGLKARRWTMRLRLSADAILAGINTVMADNPQLTYRGRTPKAKPLWRVVLDSSLRIPLASRLLNDAFTPQTIIVTTDRASRARRGQVEKTGAKLLIHQGRVSLPLLLDQLGEREITHLLVEGGGEAHASFLREKLVQRLFFLYAPKIIGGKTARPAVGGGDLPEPLKIARPEWFRIGRDLLLAGQPQLT